MLYNNFIVCMMVCAFMALLCMIDNGDWQYIILPIGILIWGIFKFFDENDRKYLEGMGIDPDEFNAFFPDEYDNYSYGRNRHHHHHHSGNVYTPNSNDWDSRREGNTITWDSPSDARRSDFPTYNGGFGGYYSRKRYENPAYKGMVKKCKRNFKISITKETEEKDESRNGVFHSVHSGA